MAVRCAEVSPISQQMAMPRLYWNEGYIWVTLAPAAPVCFPRPMHFKTFSAAVFGIDAYLVEVEVDVGSGKPGDFNVVGLPDIAVKESRERIKAALKNCGHDFPLQSV